MPAKSLSAMGPDTPVLGSAKKVGRSQTPSKIAAPSTPSARVRTRSTSAAPPSGKLAISTSPQRLAKKTRSESAAAAKVAAAPAVVSPSKGEDIVTSSAAVDDASPPPRPTGRRSTKSQSHAQVEGASEVVASSSIPLTAGTSISAAPRRSGALLRKSNSAVQCPTPMPPSPPMPKAIFITCSLCGLTTPFCAQTGRPHMPVAPCVRCGLSTAFCPMTGAPHDLHIPLAGLTPLSDASIDNRRSAASTTIDTSTKATTTAEAIPPSVSKGKSKVITPLVNGKSAVKTFVPKPAIPGNIAPVKRPPGRPPMVAATQPAPSATKNKPPIPSSIGARRAPNTLPAPKATPPIVKAMKGKTVAPVATTGKSKVTTKTTPGVPRAPAKSEAAAKAPDSETLSIADYVHKYSALFETPKASQLPSERASLISHTETDNATAAASRAIVLPPQEVNEDVPSDDAKAPSPKRQSVHHQSPQCAGCTKTIKADVPPPSSPGSSPHHQPSIQCTRCRRQYHSKCFLENAGGSQLNKQANGNYFDGNDASPAPTKASPKAKASPKSSPAGRAVPEVLTAIAGQEGPSPVEWLAAASQHQVCQVCLSGIVGVEQLVAAGKSSDIALSKIITNSAAATRAEHYVLQLLINGFSSIPLQNQQPEADDDADDDDNSPLSGELTALKNKTDLLYRNLRKCHDIQADARPGQTPSLETGYSNFRERGEGRYELVEPFFMDTLLPIISKSGADGSYIMHILKAALNRSETAADGTSPKAALAEASKDAETLLSKLREVTLRPMSSGCFYSLSGSSNQNWHTDGPSLSGGGDVETLLPYAINVFVPLVPLTNQNGTDFQPGTHLAPKTITNLKALLKEAEGSNFDEPQWDKWFSGKTAPAVPLGNALLFDYRVEHRGLGNKGFADRPCVYITYAQPWYVDTYNFGAKRYAHRLELPADWQIGRSERAARRDRLSQQLQSQADE